MTSCLSINTSTFSSTAKQKQQKIDRRRHDRRIVSAAAGVPAVVSDAVLTTRLLTAHAAAGSPEDARQLFDSLPHRNLYQWNAMISAYARNALFEDAIVLFLELLCAADLKVDAFTLPCVLKACGGVKDVDMGRGVHGLALKSGLGSDAFVNNSLVSMYGKCGFVEDAFRVFDKMPERNLVSWNTMISGFGDNGMVSEAIGLFRVMACDVGESMRMDDATLVTILPMCAVEGWVEMGRAVHGLAIKLNLDHLVRVNNALIDMYAKCGLALDAECLFGNNGLEKNVVSWNVMIDGLVRKDSVDEAFDLLREMRIEGLKIDEVTVLNVLPACLGLSQLQILKELHGYVVRNEIQSNDLVPNALISAYAKCGLLEYADIILQGMEVKTVSSWNALIGGYAQNGDPSKAKMLFLQMLSSGLQPDWFSIGSLLLACTNLNDLPNGKLVHGYILRNGLEKDLFISVSLLSLYMQCGSELDATLLFDMMKEKNSVSWNAMISGYYQNGYPEKSLQFIRQMQQEGYKPSAIAVTTALVACAELSALRLGKEAHCFALKLNFTSDTYVGSSIIDMYAKCGSLLEARLVFDNLKVKDAVSWTVMITGYGINGDGYKAIELYNEMEVLGFKPDAFTYLGLLMACNHTGLIEEGLRYFEDMRSQHGLEPKLEHYACVSDMLGRAGRLDEASRLIEEMPEEPDSRIWSALLGACRIHGDISLGKKVAETLIELEPEKTEHYVLASNLFAGAGMWTDVRNIRKRLKEIGLRKDPGCSWIDLDGKFYTFVSGENRLPDSDRIHEMWCTLEMRIRDIGYIPDTSSVLHELEDQEKLKILQGHSEKQAIAYGLLKTSKTSKIRVFKNLRICQDCHCAVKLISKATEREIIVRDNKRFHHFRDGLCSCKDFW